MEQTQTNQDEKTQKFILNFKDNSIIDKDRFLKLFELTDEQYKNLKGEIKVFIDKKKDKRFMIFPVAPTPYNLAWELSQKVMPIIDFIFVRNMYPDLVIIMKNLI